MKQQLFTISGVILVLLCALVAVEALSIKLDQSAKKAPMRGVKAQQAGYFTVIGDFGRQGKDNQLEVAQQIVLWCQARNNANQTCDFSLGVGGGLF